MPKSPATILNRGLASPPKGAKKTDRHHQRDNDLHGGPPKFTKHAFKPKAVPWSFLGEKVLILDMELAKLPPPTPDHSAINWNTHSGHSKVLQRPRQCRWQGQQHSSGQENSNTTTAIQIRNEAGIRMVAPEIPAIAVSVKSSSLVNRKPRLSICTVMMPHSTPQSRITARGWNPEIAVRNLLAGALPKLVVSGRQSEHQDQRSGCFSLAISSCDKAIKGILVLKGELGGGFSHTY
ncbi:MAG: hypothetical protein IPH37_12630 [Burkholderiales bacterium]|nr:hypothetical protein [Burkholderiales bacterium]